MFNYGILDTGNTATANPAPLINADGTRSHLGRTRHVLQVNLTGAATWSLEASLDGTNFAAIETPDLSGIVVGGCWYFDGVYSALRLNQTAGAGTAIARVRSYMEV